MGPQVYVGLHGMDLCSRFTNNGGNVDAAYRKVWAAFLPMLREYLPEDKLDHERLLITNGEDPARLTVLDLPVDRLTGFTKLIEVTGLCNDLTPGPFPDDDEIEAAERANPDRDPSDSDATTSDRDAYLRSVDDDFIGWEEDEDPEGADGPETEARDLQFKEASGQW